jgi:hypothetical protein
MVLDVINVARSKDKLLGLLEQHSLLDELAFDPRISDTFANDLIRANPDLRNEISDTASLKLFARDLCNDLYPQP